MTFHTVILVVDLGTSWESSTCVSFVWRFLYCFEDAVRLETAYETSGAGVDTLVPDKGKYLCDERVFVAASWGDFYEGETVQSLIRDAVEIRKKAYCPYSNFAVGAAILTERDSKVYTGCNIENAALAPSICAERAALPKAVSDGYLNFKMVAVVAHQQNFTAPCGFCRQSLSEFVSTDGDTDIYLSRPTMDQVLCTKLSKLLPISFISYKKDNVIT